MKKILVSGGHVHCYIDAVKIVTNRFKGGRMAELANKLHQRSFNVTYLCPKDSVHPTDCKIIYHNGFEDYRAKVKEIAPEMDAVILGAAVCNLIPLNPLKGKFPSHNYKPGDVIPINFTIAPRIVDEVKNVMKKDAHLFAFKLLKGVEHEELVEAAYEIVMESKATCVFANDANDLDVKYAITKEHADIKLTGDEYIGFIEDCLNDKYYRTEMRHEILPSLGTLEKIEILLKGWSNCFEKTYGKEKYIFGTIAVRDKKGCNAFVTTTRGKKSLDELSFISDVDHNNLIVYASGFKASLNAPLLHHIFEQHPNVMTIIHHHGSEKNVDILPYAIPGTKRDSLRDVPYAFEIKNHGMFLCYED